MREEQEENTSPLDELEEIREHVDVLGEREQPRTEEDHLSIAGAPTRYRVEPDIPGHEDKRYFDKYRGSYGRHVALSNMPRMDNPRHLTAIDLMYIWDDMPAMRHRAARIRVREVSEFQMCRSNQEIGGFEAKMSSTIIKRENVDLKQMQSLIPEEREKKKRRSILGFLRR